MSASVQPAIQQRVDEAFRTESRRVLATLIRILGDFDLAEEALHEAFAAAVVQWERDGVPANPRAWLVSAGRFKAVDAIRRRSRLQAALPELAQREQERTASGDSATTESTIDEGTQDDQLRLIFACCHPALSPETQVALTLREVCGLRTEEIAAAFLTSPATIAQRIVRGKNKIRDAKIPYNVPAKEEMHARLESVLAVVYLVFNEGYSSSIGDQVTRPALSEEAIRLGRLLLELAPDAEVQGLLALMLLQESRRTARTSPSGDIILLEEQNRTLWNRAHIDEGIAHVRRALSTGPIGVYTVQGAIAAVHAEANAPEATDWSQIVALYDLLYRIDPSPIIELNRAVAVAMRDGPAAGIELIEAILTRGELQNYHLTYAAQADLYRRLGNRAAARRAYQQAIDLAKQEPEIRFLRKRLQELA
ncbi:MAG: RNA polymerase sigma factor [Planctomycetota bacterium]|nr:RNA polymerase sigma factor [Planctomycetota bacterium]